MRRTAEPTFARTRCRFGYHTARVRLCAWEMLWPKRGPFPQISQTLAISQLQDLPWPLPISRERHPSTPQHLYSTWRPEHGKVARLREAGAPTSPSSDLRPAPSRPATRSLHPRRQARFPGLTRHRHNLEVTGPDRVECRLHVPGDGIILRPVETEEVEQRPRREPEGPVPAGRDWPQLNLSSPSAGATRDR